MSLHLSHPVTVLPGIGSSAAKDLRALEIVSVGDLLWHLPFRYDDFSRTTPIAELRHDDTVTVEATVKTIASRPARNRRVTVTEAIVEDESGAIKVMWFNQPYLTKTLRAGSRVALAGRVDARFGLTFMNPVWEPAGVRVHTGRIVPVYSLTGSLTQRRLRSAMKHALAATEEFIEWLPRELVQDESFPSFAQAMEAIHFPEHRGALDAAIERIKFDELFLHQLQFAHVRRDRAKRTATPVSIDEDFLRRFVTTLPFTLTKGQKAAAWEVVKDCANAVPMNRLLQGDVGSGKTAVAALAIAHAMYRGQSCAYLAPTELLATQQANALHQLISNARIVLLTGSQSAVNGKTSTRAEALEAVAGETVCFVGTHALLQEGLTLPKLALVVVDEQHRFGVAQRHALLRSDPQHSPHLLSMTATPIPRSLALTLYGDLDVSIIRERPAGRKPIATFLIEDRDRAKMWRQVLSELREGRQAYVVCPLIDPSDQTGMRSVSEVAQELRKKELKGCSVGILHGKMKSEEKTKAIEEFRSGKTAVLVATTVVEVGVDVPNATAMVILGAERFGLAQLHQLRGRVGRSDLASFCFLVPDTMMEKSRERLQALVQSQDWFALAEKDLELRGAGNVFGNAQSGFPDFQLATIADVPLMKKARDWAARILERDVDLSDHVAMKERVAQSFDRVHLE